MDNKKRIANLSAVFEPKSVAVVGASADAGKIGHVLLKNFIEGGFEGRLFAVNPHEAHVLGIKCYPKISAISENVDLAVVATPADSVLGIVSDCAKKGVRGMVVISSGFSEIGKEEEEKKIGEIARKNDIALIGPNCMGVLNPGKRNDSVFLPLYKMGRPKAGKISFLSQSGAVGGCIVDLAARAGVGISKFVSYGNACAIDECDLLEYFEKDADTEIVIVYLEGVRDGRRLLEIGRRLTRKKPVIVLKAGKGDFGKEAAKSHTGSMAGSYEAYKAAFFQAGMVEAGTLDELFDFAKVFTQKLPLGKRVAVLTNGGGNGVLAADAIEEEGLELAEISSLSRKRLSSFLPAYANVKNPLDIIGDADTQRYGKSLEVLLSDKGVDAVIVIVLFQTLGVDSGVVKEIVRLAQGSEKPVLVVSTGGEYTEMHKRILDGHGVPTYPSPSSAVRALSRLVFYSCSLGKCRV